MRHRRRSAHLVGLAAIELLCAVVGAILAGWLAAWTARHFEGVWRWIVLGAVFLVGYVVIFLSVPFSLSWLVAHLPDRQQPQQRSSDDKNPNGGSEPWQLETDLILPSPFFILLPP